MWQRTRPIYVQIRDLIAAAIIDGDYGVGNSLPSVRTLAAGQEVNPLTVSKAYQELQSAGLVTARRGLGCSSSPARASGCSPMSESSSSRANGRRSGVTLIVLG